MSSSMLRFRMARWRWALGKVIVVAAVAALAVLPPVLNKTKAASGSGKAAAPAAAPATLSSVPVPLPPNLGDFVTDRAAAIVLGKSLFWDMQAGGDGKQACASCHFQAGVDNRTRNTINPRGGAFRGANYQLTSADYPFHRLADPNNNASAVLSDTKEVTGSQGLIKADFLNINEGSPADSSTTVPDATFNIGGVNARQVTGRNTPTIINAVFNNRNFWDGRANRFFNGVNPFGEMDAGAKVWSFDGTAMTQVSILLDNASLASQAVGPPNNNVEMSFNGRTFPLLGRKMLSLPPLGTQKVDPTDSVLGSSANVGGTGLLPTVTYAGMIRSAFNSK
ncbi:MAG TPA: cytochrome c peroxidase, partial [Planctomycetaceae bacterium]|nr:cytochrome c peroxidase [Planctomycetaceae bacterium]